MRMIHNPETRPRLSCPNAESDWLTTNVPNLLIIGQKLSDAATVVRQENSQSIDDPKYAISSPTFPALAPHEHIARRLGMLDGEAKAFAIPRHYKFLAMNDSWAIARHDFTIISR